MFWIINLALAVVGILFVRSIWQNQTLSRERRIVMVIVLAVGGLTLAGIAAMPLLVPASP